MNAPTRPPGMIDRFVRPGARALLTLYVRLTHRRRRGRLIERLRRTARDVDSVLFVCLGNVCRSPYAERWLRARLSRHPSLADLRVDSAGFIGPGRASPDTAGEVAAGRGVSLEGHCSKTVEPRLFARGTLPVVMEVGQKRRLRRLGLNAAHDAVVLGDLDPVVPDRRTIRDPWGADEAVFRDAFDRIDRCLVELVDALERGRSA